MSFDYRGILGPDVSFYQDDDNTKQGIDFAKMKAAGASFVIIRCAQNKWPDPDFSRNIIEAHKAGLKTGIYGFFDSRADPIEQADLILSLIKGLTLELGVWADFEERYDGPYKGPANWRKYLARLKANTPKVGIYTAPSYWNENRARMSASDLAYFKTFPLWIANYGVLQPAIPFPWTYDDAYFWQYGFEDGPKHGAESLEIDMNYFNGDADKFHAIFGGEVSVPVNEPETPAEPETKTITYWTGKLTRDVVTFSEPNKSGKRRQIKPGKIKKGTVVRGYSNKLGSWTQLYSPVNATVKTKQLPKDYGQATVTVPVTPPVVKKYKGWRCLHANEGGFVNPDSMPNVRRAKDISPVKFTPALQKLAVEVMLSQNPEMTESSALAVFNGGRAFCNGHEPESDDPKLMDGIICAGAFIADPVSFEDGYLVALPGVHAIDPSKPLPTAQEVIERGWYFVATTGKGASGAFNFPQGKLGPVCVIYALAEPARYQKSWFVRWESDVRPDALRYGG